MSAAMVKVEALQPDPKNARAHPTRNVEAIKASLSRFGQQRPIIATKDGTVVAGNGVLMAARELGWAEVLVTYTALDGAALRQFKIADNRTAELSEWDYPMLAAELEELKDADLEALHELGWADHELAPVLGAHYVPASVSENGADTEVPALPIRVTADQRAVIDDAIAKLRANHGDEKIGEGAAVAEICRAWMAAS